MIAAGSRVVLPDPGGATTTRDFPASPSMMAGTNRSIGSGVMEPPA